MPIGISAAVFTEQRALLLEQLDSDHARIVTVLALGIQTPIWEIRSDAGKPLLDAIMLDRRDRDQRFVAAGAAFPEITAPQSPGDATLLSRIGPVLHEGEIIGEVRVEMSTDPLEAQLATRWSQILLIGVLQLIIGLVVIAALLRFKVMAPLQQLIDQSETLAAGALDQPLVWQRRDELGALGRSFEKCVSPCAIFSRISNKATRRCGGRSKSTSAGCACSEMPLKAFPMGSGVYDASRRLIICNSAFASLCRCCRRPFGGLYGVGTLLTDVTPMGEDRQSPAAKFPGRTLFSDANWSVSLGTHRRLF